MHLFSDYIQPLTLWLYAHPHWALFITFLISFSESLAIIGSIVPGSVTMTTIGILAGSGVMRIDLTFLAATLGAIAGDSGSYALGYLFSDRLTNMWPFKNYPSWVVYGQDYFTRYGAASVLIGRFVGPLRSIIPAIAGMMHMNHWHFLIANALSAVGWAILYVMPGVLIGAASSELSTESATRLFILILGLLVFIWLVGLGIKWLLVHANQFLRANSHDFWLWLTRHPRLAYFTKHIAPYQEVNHYPTAALVILATFSFFISITLVAIALQSDWIAPLNNLAYLFFQSVKTEPLEAFFIVISIIISPVSLLTLIAAVALYAVYYKDWRTLRYWSSLSFISVLIIFLLTFSIDVPQPTALSKHHMPLLFPEVNLTFAIALLGFLFFYVRSHYQTIGMFVLRILLLFYLFLAGMAVLYLGDNWLINVVGSYFIGLTLCLVHWIFYRRNRQHNKRSQLTIVLVFISLAIASYISYLLDFKKLVEAHSPHLAQYVITEPVWWNQQQPLLPIFSTNRIGQKKGMLNIQYVGSLKKLQQTLETHHWKQQKDSLLYSLLIRAGGINPDGKLPLMAQFYQNKKPTLIMIYRPKKNSKLLLILRLWRSNYHLRHYQQPIWLGSVDYFIKAEQGKWVKSEEQHRYIIDTLPEFEFKQINVHVQSLQSPPSAILLIKDPMVKTE